MSQYTREQLNNIRRIKATRAYQAATPLERKALFEATIVESGIRDLNYGDRDSKGILQQRNNGAWGGPHESIEKDIAQFLAVARRKSAGVKDAGQLAQAVQVSGFPARYGQHAAEAAALVGSGTPSAKAPAKTYGVVSKGSAPTLTPGGDTVDTRGAVTAALLDHSGGSLAKRILGNVTSGRYTTSTDPKVTAGTAPKYKVAAGTPTRPADGRGAGGGVSDFEGTKVAAWIAPALTYARKHGWTGKVNSGYRSFADQTRIYNSGVRPAAKPGTSNHEGTAFPRGAIDVSDAAQLSAILQASPFAKKLVYAGAKDPVHFSHPHGGSY